MGGRTPLGPYRSFTRSPTQVGGTAAAVPPHSAPGQTPSRLPPSSTGRKTSTDDFVSLHGERGRAAHHGEDTGGETQATALDPRTRVRAEFPPESEAFVFHPHPADPRPKCCLRSPPGRLVAASVSFSVTRRPLPGCPGCRGAHPRSLVPHLTPHRPPRDPPKREELAPGLERPLVSVWHLASPSALLCINPGVRIGWGRAGWAAARGNSGGF